MATILSTDTSNSNTLLSATNTVYEVRATYSNETGNTALFVMTLDGTGSTLLLQNGGAIHSAGTGSALVLAAASHSVIVGPDSTILGAAAAIDITASGTLNLVNSGLVRSTSGTATIRNAGNGSTVDNFGEISNIGGGNAYAAILNSGSVINNHGIIRSSVTDSALDLGDLNDAVNNDGTIVGVTKLYAGTDSVFNTGTMRGDIVVDASGGGNKTIFNSGLMSTTLTYAAWFGAGNDSITNSGLIQGDIDLGDGTDKIVNSGTIVGRINIDSGTGGNKTIINTGTISNPFIQGINFESGNDRIVNYGLIERLVFMGDGADTYIALDGGVALAAINGGAGADSLTGGGSVDGFIGGADSDTLKGNGGDDLLDGGTGNDTMQGDGGNDRYTVDSALDVIVESAGEGSDTVNTTASFTLAAGAEIEFLTNTLGTGLTLTGNATVQTITGSAVNDTLGGGGNGDTLVGLAGNDTYALGAFTATIVDSAGTADLVTSTITRSLAAFTTIENLTLLGTGNIDGTGNALANTITGSAGKNVLSGGADAVVDTLIGLAGNDTYVLGNAGDIVVDSSGTADLITSTIGRSLVSFATIENLTLLGTGNGIGNNLNNVISGSGSANTLNGGIGNDTLIGGIGNDTLIGAAGIDTLIGGIGIDTLTGGANRDFFVFNAPLSAANRDNVTDFSAPLDTFRLENAVMTKLGAAGALNVNAFFAGAAANDASDRIIYNQVTGALIYDSNGNAAGGAIQIATLTTLKPVLTAADFAVI